jgi:hypothetical protein
MPQRVPRVRSPQAGKDPEMSSREERLAQNEILFRQVNERIVELTDRWGNSLDLVCECADDECMARIELTLHEYEQLRENPRCFAVLPGHEIRDVEDVVGRTERYIVVEKHLETHDQVESANPRS